MKTYRATAAINGPIAIQFELDQQALMPRYIVHSETLPKLEDNKSRGPSLWRLEAIISRMFTMIDTTLKTSAVTTSDLDFEMVSEQGIYGRTGCGCVGSRRRRLCRRKRLRYVREDMNTCPIVDEVYIRYLVYSDSKKESRDEKLYHPESY